MTTTVGIDLSTFRLDAATILPSSLTFHNVVLGKPKHSRVDRIRRVPDAVNRLTRVSHNGSDLTRFAGGIYERPDLVIIEDPFGQGTARKALDEVVGAIIASIGHFCPRAEVDLISASEWRKALGAKNTKEAGARAAWEWLEKHPSTCGRHLDEHELDALGVAAGYITKKEIT